MPLIFLIIIIKTFKLSLYCFYTKCNLLFVTRASILIVMKRETLDLIL